MFCPKCGNEIKNGGKFCPKCGNSLGDGIANASPEINYSAHESIPKTYNAEPAYQISDDMVKIGNRFTDILLFFGVGAVPGLIISIIGFFIDLFNPALREETGGSIGTDIKIILFILLFGIIFIVLGTIPWKSILYPNKKLLVSFALKSFLSGLILWFKIWFYFFGFIVCCFTFFLLAGVVFGLVRSIKVPNHYLETDGMGCQKIINR